MEFTDSARVLPMPGNRQIALVVHDAVRAGVIRRDMVGLFRLQKIQPPDIMPDDRKLVAEHIKRMQGGDQGNHTRKLTEATRRMRRLLNGNALQFMMAAEMAVLDAHIKMQGYDEHCAVRLRYLQTLILVAVYYPKFLYDQAR